jgi:integrase
MARRVIHTNLQTRTARLQLAVRGLPYWVLLESGLHLGYRRLKGTGKWLVRRYLGRGSTKNYEMRVIAQADDYSDADGEVILTYDQAQARARGRRYGDAPLGRYEVSQAVADYISFLRASGKDHRDTEGRAKALIVPQLGHLEVSKLTADQLRKWLAGIAEAPIRVRTPKGELQRFRALPVTDEDRRRRRSTANRVLRILKATLNHAFDEGKCSSTIAWGRKLKAFRNVEGKRTRYLSMIEVRRLLDACDDANFRDLVEAALHTGCRFSELVRMRVRDFNPDVGTLFVARSKPGKGRHVVLTDKGAAFFLGLCGRYDDRPFADWNCDNQRRAMISAVAKAGIPKVVFHELRHTWASHAVMNETPLQVVAANLGHSDTRMVERHYGHLAPSFISDAIRRGAPTYV